MLYHSNLLELRKPKMFDLSSKVLQDLELLATLDSSTISEFCKLAIEQLAKLVLGVVGAVIVIFGVVFLIFGLGAE